MKKISYISAIFLILAGCCLAGGIFFAGRMNDQKPVQKEIAKEVLRFHIRANSDREQDQNLKLKVKTQVVSYLQSLLYDCKSKAGCQKKIEKNLHKIEKLGAAVCRSEGKNVSVHAYLTREAFPLKQYGDMILPSGVYDALRVDLGEGEGKNWWCMMYPSLCTAGGAVEKVPKESKAELKEHLSEEAYQSLFWESKEDQIMENSVTDPSKDNKYHIKWKIIESFEKYFSKK